jgi:GNAT superfamily N-acetyltransferase
MTNAHAGESGSNAKQFQAQETLDDGTAVTIRAVRPDDKARIVKAFLALEPHSIYARFFYAKSELSEQELRQLTEIDYVSAVVLLATIGTSPHETVIGLGRYAATGRSAEIAFVVEEDYAGRGIAKRLLQHLTHIARDNGVAKFEADVLGDNAPMLAVFRHSGLTMTTTHSDGVTHVTLLI